VRSDLPSMVKRAVLKGPRDLEFQELPLPFCPPEGGAVARTEISAVSVGTEMSAYAGEPPLRPGTVYPRLVGYCNVARVLEAHGPDMLAEPGDLIITHRPHESHFACEPSAVLAKIPAGADPCGAALTYLAHIGLGALSKCQMVAGEHVAVLGLGPIGLATVGVARCLGGNVVALGNDPWRMEKAREQGASACFGSNDPALNEKILDATSGHGIDLLVTTANSWAAWKTALEVPRVRGRIGVVGFPGRSEGVPPFNPLDSALCYDKQLNIVFAGPVLVSPDRPAEALKQLRSEMCALLNWIREGKLLLGRLITHRLPWHQLKNVYELAAGHEKTMIGVILEWGQRDG
jgi:NADPH:quinone reductase-like Zn-dependent oxidoreductase